MTRAALLAGAVTLSAATVALAYVPGTKTVFRHFAEKQAFERVSAGTLLGYGVLMGSPVQAPLRMEMTFPGTCKTQVDFPTGRSGVTVTATKFSVEGAPPPPFEAFVALACPIEAMKNVPIVDAEAAIAKLATSWGIDQGVTSLSRLDRRAAFVVGARPRDLSKPQIWFDKDTSRPLRIIAKYGGKLWDIRFTDPGSIATSRRTARVADVWQGNERLLNMHFMSAEIDKNGPEAPPNDEDTSEED